MKPVFKSISEGFPSHVPRRAFRLLIGLMLFFYPFSIVFVGFGFLPGDYAWTASIILVIYAGVMVLSEFRSGSMARVMTLFVCIVLSLHVVEIIGVGSGYPFGSYTYTDALKPVVEDVPIVIALSWYTVLIASYRIAQGVPSPRPWTVVVLTALLTVTLDVALEPTATYVHRYWIWQDGVIPFQNYFAWFVLSFIGASVLQRIQPTAHPMQRPSSLIVYLLQLILFVVTDIAHGYYGEALFSVSIAAMIVVLCSPQRNPLSLFRFS